MKDGVPEKGDVRRLLAEPMFQGHGKTSDDYVDLGERESDRRFRVDEPLE